MKKQRKTAVPSVWISGTLAALVLALTALGTSSRSIAQPPTDVPLQFRIIGRFLEPEKDEEAGGVNAFTVNVLKKTWILDIESSHTLEGTALGSSILKRIYPPIMSLVGPQEITDQLTDPAIEGKTCTLTGQLYVQKRLFRLTRVEGPEEEGETEAEPAAP